MTGLDDLATSNGERDGRNGLPFAWSGLVLLGLGVAIAIGGPIWGTVWGMWRSFERIERDPVPTPEELSASADVDVSGWSTVVGGVVALVGLVVILVSAWSRNRLRSRDAPRPDERVP